MKKIALIAYNGEAMCFVHVMLYALDFKEKGYDVKVVIEGAATKLIAALDDPEAPFAALYREIKEKGLVDCVCQACSAKMGTLKAAEDQGLRIIGEMKGHPSIEGYLKEQYEIITF